jgi:hypothetical protein
MQTFLPVPDFLDGARLLDSPRLGKQRVETLQILRAIELPDYGWANHPAVSMWRGRTPALVAYGLAMVAAWQERGFADSTQAQIAEFAPEVAGVAQDELAAAGLLPSWLGDDALHRSHRSNLLAKDPGFYRARFAELFGPEPADLPYVWPPPDAVEPLPEPDGTPVWVFRPRSHGEVGAGLLTGVIGLGTQSGIDVDATGLAPAELRTLSFELSGRRPAKDLRQLSTFLDDVAPGDPVAVPIEHGTALLLGEITGDYHFQGRELLPHRRPVRWAGVAPRAAAPRPATLQDPRALFSVLLEPAALHRTGLGQDCG